LLAGCCCRRSSADPFEAQAHQVWEQHINRRGGLLGRQVRAAIVDVAIVRIAAIENADVVMVDVP
jgi:hypothetical protein